MDEARLARVPLFADLSRREREHVARFTDELDFPEGRQLATEGDFAYEFFVIEDGTVDVIQQGERVNKLGPGDFFGEIGAMGGIPRVASVITTSPVRAIVMTAHDLRAVAREMPEVADRIRAAIEERSRELAAP